MKKAPADLAGAFLVVFIVKKKSAAAGTGTAGAGTTSAAATDRVGGGDGES